MTSYLVGFQMKNKNKNKRCWNINIFAVSYISENVTNLETSKKYDFFLFIFNFFPWSEEGMVKPLSFFKKW